MDIERVVELAKRGLTQEEIAERVGVHRATVGRLLQKARDERGPLERAVGILVGEWGELDASMALRAEVLRGLAIIADKGARATTGAAMAAGVAAAKELKVMLGELGASEGLDKLIDALRRVPAPPS